ncbi:MAG: hypothetical protein ACLPHI_20250 [Terriglobales bacterium]
MTSTGKRNNQKLTTQATDNHSDNTLSSWSRQQRVAMIASFAILVLLLAAAACSKQSSKPALVGVSSPASTPAIPATTTTAALPPDIAPNLTAAGAPEKKTPRKRPANVTYRDPDSGVSFLYPRKALLTAGYQDQPELTAVGNVPMNFVQPGGITIATVALPGNSYPGTDFASAFFNVNVNRKISEQECFHFAFVDTRNADGEPLDAEKVTIGTNKDADKEGADAEMEMTSNFSASAFKQVETQYYHNFENGACYEYVLGLGTEGFATEGGIEHVNRDAVFARLENILVTVKINPTEPIAEPGPGAIASGKE